MYKIKQNSILLFIIACLLYANTLTHDYTQDDAIVIYENEYTTQGIAGIPSLLKYDTFRGFFKEAGKANLVAGGRYRPLTPVMFAIEWEVFGKKPFIGHLLNILLFALTSVVLYRLLLRLLVPNFPSSIAYFVSLAASILFITHPIHTEAIANIKGRDEIVTLLLSLSALYFSLKYFEKNEKKYWIWSGIAFFLGLLSKENAITFLAVVPLSFYFFTKASNGNIFYTMRPYLSATVLFLLVRTAVLGVQSGTPPMELLNNPYLKLVGDRYVPFSAAEKTATIFYTMGKYLLLLVFPHPLTHDYYPHQIPTMTWSSWQSILSLLTYLALGAFAFVNLKRKNPISYAILFFLATFFIVSNLPFPIGTNMSERFMYMPSVGFCLGVAWLLSRLFAKNETSKSYFNLAMGIVLLVGLLFAAKTVTRNAVWKDNFTLFTTDIQVSKNSAKLQNAVGGELISFAMKPENEAQKTDLIGRAVGHLQEAVRLHPTYKNAYLLLGNAYYYTQQFEKAEQYYDVCLQQDNSYKEALNNKALLYEEWGKKYGGENQFEQAISYFKKAIALQPDNAKLLFFLGSTYGRAGQPQEAITYLKKALESAPTRENDGAIFANLATAYQQLGDIPNAQLYQQKAQNLGVK